MRAAKSNFMSARSGSRGALLALLLLIGSIPAASAAQVTVVA